MYRQFLTAGDLAGILRLEDQTSFFSGVAEQLRERALRRPPCLNTPPVCAGSIRVLQRTVYLIFFSASGLFEDRKCNIPSFIAVNVYCRSSSCFQRPGDTLFGTAAD